MKKRQDPSEQGSWKELYKHFFGRLIQYKPESMSIRDWFTELFHHKYRNVARYRTLGPFTIPGLLYRSPTVKIQGIGIRGIGSNTILYVRTDDRAPDNIDLEWVATGQTFCLTQSEWNGVAPHLTLEEKTGRTWPTTCVRCGQDFFSGNLENRVCGECPNGS